METIIIGDYEITYTPDGEPALVIHHVVRGYDAAVLDAAAVATLRDLLSIQQKRIRNLGKYQAIFGSGGDMALYTAAGQRSVYLNADQTVRLAALLAANQQS
ncbi:MAG: hypothetical protein RMK84_14230 [Oscillochloridaceae bacterium]|nr:hypothetical protein [Chloroflexaceae bacterium]MDW8391279.1 hypothetical protein [Oscillochloridaceae bacterium]